MICRAVKDGSKITLSPASFAIVSKTAFDELVMFRMSIGVRESGFNSGGADKQLIVNVRSGIHH